MRKRFGKFAFIHRRLWRDDATYRAAFLAGPPPLIGLSFAIVAWFGFHASAGMSGRTTGPVMPWAHYVRPVTVSASGRPIKATPDAGLPAVGHDGKLAGLTTGWRAQILPLQVDPTMDVHITPTPSSVFFTDATAIDLDRIVAAGPPSGLFIGSEATFLAVEAAGTYGLTIHMERTGDSSADCLQRFAFDHRRLVSNLRVNISGEVSHTYDPAEFDLNPGLYRMYVAFACWSGNHTVGPGKVTVMIRRPGDQGLTPARPDEIVRPLASD